MVTKRLHILQTHNTPEFIFSPEGTIKIKGRALMVNNSEVPKQIKNWIDAYLSNPAETTEVIFAFEFLNSLSSTIIISILRKISESILLPKKLAVRWYYEEEDDDMLELGKYISEICDISIELSLIKDIKSL
jgi:hypothetical protein